ncbi:MAG: hypothetical protein ACOH2M_27160 [Cypionkella sp.]
MTGLGSWLTETPEDYDDRMEARAIARGNRALPEHDYSPRLMSERVLGPDGWETRFDLRDPLAYLNFD